MPRKTNPFCPNYLVEQYRAGRPIKDIASELGIGVNTVYRSLNNSGIDTSMRSEHRAILSKEGEIIDLFNSGIGVRGIANKFACAPSTIGWFLERNGINLRNRSEQQFARMSRTTPEERQRLAAKAHEAVRGRKRSIEEMSKVAVTLQGSPKWRGRRSHHERKLNAMLLQKGVEFTPQLAVGPYNCDFAIGPVAVEVFGGHWHWHGDHLARTEERFNYLMDRGFNVLAIPVNKGWPLTDSVADYIISYVEQSRANPTAPREYRVVWGAGEFFTCGGLNDHNFSIEPPFTSSRDPATGQYKRIPR